MIIDQLSNDLVENHVVTVRRFGTLSPVFRSGYTANDISKHEVRQLDGFCTVRFHPHESFRALIQDRKSNFRDVDLEKNLDRKKKR